MNPSDSKSAPRRRPTLGALVLVGGILVIGALVWLIVSRPEQAPKVVPPDIVQLKLLPPPPPPPPPKQQPEPVDQPKPEPQPQEFKAEVPEPDPQPQDPSPAPPGPLALDGPGSGPGDGFGLMGGGGGGWGGSGTGTGGGGSEFGWYSALVKSKAEDTVRKNRRLGGRRYVVGVEMWVDSEGAVERVALIGSTGREDTDRLLRDTLEEIARLPQKPPKDMPQPIVFRITSA